MMSCKSRRRPRATLCEVAHSLAVIGKRSLMIARTRLNESPSVAAHANADGAALFTQAPRGPMRTVVANRSLFRVIRAFGGVIIEETLASVLLLPLVFFCLTKSAPAGDRPVSADANAKKRGKPRDKRLAPTDVTSPRHGKCRITHPVPVGKAVSRPCSIF